MNDPFHDAIFRMVQEQRWQEFAQSPQLALGEIIAKLEAIPDQAKAVLYVFEYAYPTTLASWRGAYQELALGFQVTVGHNLGQEDPTVASILIECRSALGQTFEGWKGGDFVMSEATPVWVANPGNSGNTGIVGVTDRGWQVTLDTAYCEY
jgi:hypothetical protein